MFGAHQPEQDGDHRGHAFEMPRACRAFERLRHGAYDYGRVEARGVDLGRVGRKDDVDALGLADPDVMCFVTRVPREVIRAAELARVDEDRDDGRGIGCASPADQGPVALVEPAHRRDEADRSRRSVEGGTQLGAGSDDLGQAGLLWVRGPRSSGMPPTGMLPPLSPGRSGVPAPEDGIEHASSIRTACSGPGKVPAATSAA